MFEDHESPTTKDHETDTFTGESNYEGRSKKITTTGCTDRDPRMVLHSSSALGLLATRGSWKVVARRVLSGPDPDVLLDYRTLVLVCHF